MKIQSKIAMVAMSWFVMGSAWAGAVAADGLQAPASVPELDGGLAFLALGLVAAIVAVIREKRRS